MARQSLNRSPFTAGVMLAMAFVALLAAAWPAPRALADGVGTTPPGDAMPRALRHRAALAMPYFSFAGLLRQRND